MVSEGAYIYMNDPRVGLIYIRTFNDSAYTQLDENFSAGDTVYYGVLLRDINDNATDSEIDVNVYTPKGIDSGYGAIANTNNGTYKGSFTLGASDELGYWIISAKVEETSGVGTALFNKS